MSRAGSDAASAAGELAIVEKARQKAKQRHKVGLSAIFLPQPLTRQFALPFIPGALTAKTLLSKFYAKRFLVGSPVRGCGKIQSLFLDLRSACHI